jgi:SAM-dependent methyltransferase
VTPSSCPSRAGSFDRVLSAFGVQFAPRHQLVADELVRVLRPGGLIALVNWTPAGLIGELFRIMGGQAARHAEAAGRAARDARGGAPAEGEGHRPGARRRGERPRAERPCDGEALAADALTRTKECPRLAGGGTPFLILRPGPQALPQAWISVNVVPHLPGSSNSLSASRRSEASSSSLSISSSRDSSATLN